MNVIRCCSTRLWHPPLWQRSAVGFGTIPPSSRETHAQLDGSSSATTFKFVEVFCGLQRPEYAATRRLGRVVHLFSARPHPAELSR